MGHPADNGKRRPERELPVGSNSEDSSTQTSLVAVKLAEEIFRVVSTTDCNDDLHRCGTAPIQLLEKRPQEALDLAHTKLHTWPFHELPLCWRRLYEDASLFLVAQILKTSAASSVNPNGWTVKRFKPSQPCEQGNLLRSIVTLLDKAIIIAGAPVRRLYIEAVLSRLGELFQIPDHNSTATCKFSIVEPELLLSDDQLPRATASLSLLEFEAHLSKSTSPLIIPRAFEHWPALECWSDLSYLMHATLNGNRLIPIEIGDTYTDETWTQRLVPFSEFVESYLSPVSPSDTGYLAQHDLFEHISALRKDIGIPDYCYTNPPPPCGAALKTAGLADSPPLDQPLLNAWLGPKGTKTPLHTDPYHNILCQVVGYKYVRLYPPEESAKLYPRGIDEAGVSMANTTQIDSDYFRPQSNRRQELDHVQQTIATEFPLFPSAKYQEGILAPGECLYIPLGWWHYVESLTTSFSVSFWWN